MVLEVINTEKKQPKPKVVSTFTLSARDIYIKSDNLDEMFKKGRALLKLGVGSVTFQLGKETVYPGDNRY